MDIADDICNKLNAGQESFDRASVLLLIAEYNGMNQKIYSLETDLIQARRVAEERQEIVDTQQQMILSMRKFSTDLEKRMETDRINFELIEKDFQILLSMHECFDFINPDDIDKIKIVQNMLVKYVG